jgi:NAD+ kinase
MATLSLQIIASVGLIARTTVPNRVSSRSINQDVTQHLTQENQTESVTHQSAASVGVPLRIITEWLIGQGCSVVVDEQSAVHLLADTPAFQHHQKVRVLPLHQVPQNCQFGIVLGGDGTLIATAREFAPYSVPLIGIHYGRLGFMTDIPLARFQEVLSSILAGEYVEDHRHMFRAQILRDKRVIFASNAINDVVIHRATIPHLIEMSVRVDEHDLMTLRADGLIIATATGSTAYSLACGGPVLHPTLAGVSINAIAPQSLSNRPIVLPEDVKIEVELMSMNRHNALASVSFDTQVFSQLQTGDKVQIVPAPYRARLLHPVGYDYFSTLKQKLNWSQEPSGV